jgi:hypothetical protein
MTGPPVYSLVSSFLPRAAPGPATIKKPVGSAGAVAVVVSAVVVSGRVRVVVSTVVSAEVAVVESVDEKSVVVAAITVEVTVSLTKDSVEVEASVAIDSTVDELEISVALDVREYAVRFSQKGAPSPNISYIILTRGQRLAWTGKHTVEPDKAHSHGQENVRRHF